MIPRQKLSSSAAAAIFVLAVVSSHTAAAFTTPNLQCRSQVNRCNTVVAIPLLESPSDQNEPGLQKYSTARIGGRRAKKQKVKKDDNTNDGPLSVFIRQVGIPILLLTLFLRLLFGNLFGGGSNVVYFSSTVYQSTTYSRDGNIETKRKESFESNIPGLVERAKERSQGYDNTKSALRGSYYDINAIEEELMDAEDEINSVFGKW